MNFTAKAPKTGDKSADPKQKAATTAHLLNTAAHQIAHVKRHMVSMKRTKGRAQTLDYEHAMTHLDGGIEHVQKVINHVKSNYPAEGKEMAALESTIPTTSTQTNVMQKVHAAHQAVKRGK